MFDGIVTVTVPVDIAPAASTGTARVQVFRDFLVAKAQRWHF